MSKVRSTVNWHRRQERVVHAKIVMTELNGGEHQFRRLAELSPAHLFRATSEGDVTFLSPGFLTMTGLSAESARGWGWLAAVHPDDRGRLTASWNEATHSQVIFQAEFRFRTAAGEFRWYRLRVVPDLDESGRIAGWVGAAIDLHELHLALDDRAVALERAEEALHVAEEVSEFKDEFLATASHELRTPLNAIVGWVRLLQSGTLTDDTRRKQAVEAIDRNALIQTRLIENLLDVSLMAQGRVNLTIAPLDLNDVVDAAVSTARAAAVAKEISLEVATVAGALPVNGDAQRLQQVVWNLLANAVKYSSKGGIIRVEATRAGNDAMVCVKDSGEGIDAAFLPLIFEPFRQGVSLTMRSGLGLGLSIVRRLVELHGGRITASSRGPGLGAEFVVTLPMDRAALATAVRPPPTATVAVTPTAPR